MEPKRSAYDLGLLAGYNDSNARNPFDPDTEWAEFEDWHEGFAEGEEMYKDANPDWDKY